MRLCLSVACTALAPALVAQTPDPAPLDAARIRFSGLEAVSAAARIVERHARDRPARSDG